MQVSDIMTRDVIFATADMTIEAAAALMVNNRLSGLPVVAGDGGLAGMITEGDLLRRVEIEAEGKPAGWLSSFFRPGQCARDYARTHGRKVGELMSDEIVTVSPTTSVSEAARLLESHRITRLPVLEDNRLVGIVTRADLLKALLAALPETSGETLPDGELHRRVIAECARQGWVPRVGFSVAAKDGYIVLSGVVPDESERVALRVIAENVPGARGVRDNLVCIEPLSGAVLG